MKRGYLSEYFAGIMAKRLKAVEADRKKSNQHEFNGVAKLKELLGENRIQDRSTLFFWFDDDEELVTERSMVTWYDAREAVPDRNAEYRLYFRANEVMRQAKEGDLLIVAKRQINVQEADQNGSNDKNPELIVIVAVSGSSAERQLTWLFGISAEDVGGSISVHSMGNDTDRELDFVSRLILEELQITVQDKDAERLDTLLEPRLDELLVPFRDGFPSTMKFSQFARSTLPDIDMKEDPDSALLAWIDREEQLFRRLERILVSDRLRQGFHKEGDIDVDGFVSFSLSVQNRRKSRAGYAVENHLHRIFSIFRLRFERNAKTENKSKPDFLFPGEKEYHDSLFPADKLTMLGVKSSCKERWRQVLAEADRIPGKHLLTLESRISENQTGQMMHSNLQLVLPKRLHESFTQSQQGWLMSLGDFIEHIQDKQKRRFGVASGAAPQTALDLGNIASRQS